MVTDEIKHENGENFLHFLDETRRSFPRRRDKWKGMIVSSLRPSIDRI